MKEQTTELIKLQKQQQQNVDTLSERIATLYNKERELNVRVSRFKDINQTYRKVKTIAQEQVNRFWSQALKEPDKKGLLSIVLSAVIETLRQRPDTNEIIFGSDNNVGNNERQDAIISVAQRLSNSLIERMVNQTLEKLETQAQTDEDEDEDADTDTDTESDVLEAIEEAQDTVVAAEAKVKDTEVDDAAAKEEEETKPKPEEET